MSFDPASYEFRQGPGPTPIRASTVLPAKRELVQLETEDGHTLVAELAVGKTPAATPTTEGPARAARR